METGAAETATGGTATGAGAAEAAGDESATLTSACTPPTSIEQITAPIGRTSPSLATICKIPSASAGNSKVALSDSNSHKTSSSFTWSPSFLFQVATVTSVIDSPTAGTFMSMAIVIRLLFICQMLYSSKPPALLHAPLKILSPVMHFSYVPPSP